MQWQAYRCAPRGVRGVPTSSSRSFLTHRHAARFLNPSPSYVRVWFGLNFIMDEEMEEDDGDFYTSTPSTDDHHHLLLRSKINPSVLVVMVSFREK